MLIDEYNRVKSEDPGRLVEYMDEFLTKTEKEAAVKSYYTTKKANFQKDVDNLSGKMAEIDAITKP